VKVGNGVIIQLAGYQCADCFIRKLEFYPMRERITLSSTQTYKKLKFCKFFKLHKIQYFFVLISLLISLHVLISFSNKKKKFPDV